MGAIAAGRAGAVDIRARRCGSGRTRSASSRSPSRTGPVQAKVPADSREIAGKSISRANRPCERTQERACNHSPMRADRLADQICSSWTGNEVSRERSHAGLRSRSTSGRSDRRPGRCHERFTGPRRSGHAGAPEDPRGSRAREPGIGRCAGGRDHTYLNWAGRSPCRRRR
jgi:hypothetical protein